MEADSGREGEREVSERRVPDATGPALMFPIRERSQLFTFRLLMRRTATIFYNSINKRILFYIAVSAALTGAFPYAPEIMIFPAPFCG